MSNVGTYPTHTADGEVLTAQYVNDLVDDVQGKVDKETDKRLMTDAEGTKLSGIASGATAVSGTNDGTNWTAITISGTTKNIPAGGGSALQTERL